MPDEKVIGPASYFPSIEKTYGRPVAHWLAELERVGDLPHLQQVAYLKQDFGIGHANALVGWFRRSGGGDLAPV